jgi:predicted RNase H-like HicB family nuclease
MATVPELPGAATQGRDMDEVRANIREAIELLLQTYCENGTQGEPSGSNR